jgi:hypothetical protein
VLALDHVLIAVDDLDAASRLVEDRYGLASVEGGRHPGWGTANRIVPLGSAYLELVAVVDETEAAQSAFGRWVGGAQRDRPFAWAVRTDELDLIARDRGLEVDAGSRGRPDGHLVEWRSAGIDRAAADPSLPFFIEWGSGTVLPGRAVVRHPVGSVEIVRLELEGDLDRISAWLGTHALPIVVGAGAPAMTRIVLSSDAGEIAVDSL